MIELVHLQQDGLRQISHRVQECIDECMQLGNNILLPTPQTMIPATRVLLDSTEPFVQTEHALIHAATMPVFEKEYLFYCTEKKIHFCFDNIIQEVNYPPSTEFYKTLPSYTHMLIKAAQEPLVQALLSKEYGMFLGEKLFYYHGYQSWCSKAL